MIMIHLEKKVHFLTKSLFFLRNQSFSKKTDALINDLSKVNQKVKLKTSVSSVKKIQKFLEETSTNNNLSHSINRTASYDTEFNEFLKKFKAKHKDIPNIVDISHHATDQSILTKSNEMR